MQPGDPHPVARVEARHFSASPLYHAHNLVPGYDRRFAGFQFSLGHVQIGPADAAGMHAHQHVARPRLGDRHFREFKRIPFDRVEAIVYTYDDWNSDAGLGYSHDSKDSFTVKLKLWNEHLVHLFNFYGEGAFVNNSPFPDWCFWDEYLLDLSGTQESESRTFVDLLQKMLDVPVTRP